MYNLSQAMGMGKVTTMDWKSIENANMATKEFKEMVTTQEGMSCVGFGYTVTSITYE